MSPFKLPLCNLSGFNEVQIRLTYDLWYIHSYKTGLITQLSLSQEGNMFFLFIDFFIFVVSTEIIISEPSCMIDQEYCLVNTPIRSFSPILNSFKAYVELYLSMDGKREDFDLH